jgi:hypothetical protein
VAILWAVYGTFLIRERASPLASRQRGLIVMYPTVHQTAFTIRFNLVSHRQVLLPRCLSDARPAMKVNPANRRIHHSPGRISL